MRCCSFNQVLLTGTGLVPVSLVSYWAIYSVLTMDDLLYLQPDSLSLFSEGSRGYMGHEQKPEIPSLGSELSQLHIGLIHLFRIRCIVKGRRRLQL